MPVEVLAAPQWKVTPHIVPNLNKSWRERLTARSGASGGGSLMVQLFAANIYRSVHEYSDLFISAD
jgi:hypothetical protein